MNLFRNIALVGHVNGYFYENDIMPAEVCIASVRHYKEPGKFYQFDLSETRFNAVDKIMNKYFAEKYLGLEFPPVQWENSVNYDYMRRYLRTLHEEQGRGIIGCIGEKQRDFFLKYCLPCVDITSFVPPYEDLQEMPLYSKHKVHKKINLPFCSINYAHRYAAYLNKKNESINADKSGLMSRLCLGWKLQ